MVLLLTLYTSQTQTQHLTTALRTVNDIFSFYPSHKQLWEVVNNFSVVQHSGKSSENLSFRLATHTTHTAHDSSRNMDVYTYVHVGMYVCMYHSMYNVCMYVCMYNVVTQCSVIHTKYPIPICMYVYVQCNYVCMYKYV